MRKNSMEWIGKGEEEGEGIERMKREIIRRKIIREK